MYSKKFDAPQKRSRENASKSRKNETHRKAAGRETDRREKPFEKFYKKEKPMDRRGEIFTERFSTDKQRTYFFNVKENRLGDLFLNIVESKESESSLGFERRQIVVFKEDLKEFLQTLNRSVDAMNNPSKKRVKIIKKK